MKPDFSGKREIYLEVAEKYESYIRLGILSPCEKLPSVRAAAQEMGINPNTMARAYSYLEERGLIYTLPKKGVYVSRPSDEETKEDTLTSDARDILSSLKERGLSREALDTLISEVYGK
jgi:GntR family transcriptional regulator